MNRATQEHTAGLGEQCTVVIIPAFNPDEKLMGLLDEMQTVGFQHFILVNDGSAPDCRSLFDAVRARPGCVLLEHEQNCGKGRALKTAFRYYLTHRQDYDKCTGVVTVDADGQHSARDAMKCARAMVAHTDRLVLGCRDFSGRKIPLRSRVGNVTTRHVFRFLFGLKVSDTQTGLRSCSNRLLAQFETAPGEAFDYEMHVLASCRGMGVTPLEIPIETIYTPRNTSSHFHPVRDSLRIYAVFLRFTASALISFGLDLLFFALFNRLLGASFPQFGIALSTLAARAISSLVNFLANRHFVFRGTDTVKSSAWRYYLLCAGQMVLSAGLVTLFSRLTCFPPTAIKSAVDSLLFLVSFSVQRTWVFRRTKKHNGFGYQSNK